MLDRMSKGISLIVLSFIVLAVALGGFLWFQQNILSGGSISSETVDTFQIDKTDGELQNSILYLESALIDAASNATQNAGYGGGRNATITVINETTGNVSEEFNETYLYWQCDPKEVHNSGQDKKLQIPTIDRIRLTLENHTMKDFDSYLNDIHGIRDGVVYSSGKNLCSEVGYYEPMNVPTNDKFKTASLIDRFTVTFEDFLREKLEIPIVNEVRYNRFWYLFDILKKWTNEQDMEGNIEDEVAKIPDYVNDVVCGFCPCPYQKGCEEIPAEWTQFIAEAADKGVSKTVDELKEDRYFDDNQVACGYTITDQYYDNSPIIMNTPIGSCNSGYSILWLCQLGYVYRAEVDTEVSCTDLRFKSIPREDLERLNFRMRLNVEAHDMSIHEEFDPPCNTLFGSCETMNSPSSFGREDFISCTIPDEGVGLCETGVDVIGELSEDDIREKV